MESEIIGNVHVDDVKPVSGVACAAIGIGFIAALVILLGAVLYLA